MVVEFAGGPGSWVARTYTATKGGGAFLNGQRLSASKTSAVNQSLLVGTGAPACIRMFPVARCCNMLSAFEAGVGLPSKCMAQKTCH